MIENTRIAQCAREYKLPARVARAENVEIVGKPMIAWAIENLDSIGPDLKFVFLVNGPEARTYSYEHIFET